MRSSVSPICRIRLRAWPRLHMTLAIDWTLSRETAHTNRADGGIRTRDPLVTSLTLYQLSFGASRQFIDLSQQIPGTLRNIAAFFFSKNLEI